jgi:predicted thioesterase
MIAVGDGADLTFQVTQADTARAMGSGDVDVLATPRVLAWLEAATVAAVAPGLAPQETTVGSRVELAHIRPSPVGAQVVVRARVSAATDRRVEFEVDATNPDGAIAVRGRIVRARVSRSVFV